MIEASRGWLLLAVLFGFGIVAWAPERAARAADDPENPECKDPTEPLLDRLFAPFSLEEDPDGPINTDRPTFTPANTVVPLGRFQVESGYTFTHDLTADLRTHRHDFPELSVRIGVANRLEFRTFWLGQTYSRTEVRPGGPSRRLNGPNDMEIGFKTQLIQGDPERKWLPTTALITSVIAPTGGSSPYSSQTVDPYINLLYGWGVTDRLTLAGSTGYLGVRQRSEGQPADSLERWNQSLVAFYSATDRLTLFHEWYSFSFTNAADNRPTHFMDTGFLFRPTPNTQLDFRAGFGLGDRPDDLFTGAGFSIRY